MKRAVAGLNGRGAGHLQTETSPASLSEITGKVGRSRAAAKRPDKRSLRNGERVAAEPTAEAVTQPVAVACPAIGAAAPSIGPHVPPPENTPDVSPTEDDPGVTRTAAQDADFVEALYLAVNPDIALGVREGLIESGLSHWIERGRDEYARRVRPSILHTPHYPPAANHQSSRDDATTDPEAFDAEGYLYLNADVRLALGSDPGAAEDHWSRHGRAERRARPGHSPFQTRTAQPADVLARPFGVNVYGTFAASSGLGTAARGTVTAMHAADIPFDLWNFDTSKGFLRVAEADRARQPRYRINLMLANADMLEALFAAFPAGQFDGAYNIAVWQWELAAFRPDWFTSFGAVDEVWTNSEFQATAIGTSSPVPVVKIPLPVQPSRPRSRVSRSEIGLPDDKFVFLCAFDVGSTSARKNPLATIEAFRDAFDDSDATFLVLKFHSNRHEPAFISLLNRAIRGMQNVLIIADELSEAEMIVLRDLSDCLVSAHRSEGFGLNIAEFMALGKPVIATDYSGSLEFLDADVGFPVDFKLVEIEQRIGPYGRGYVWAEPDRASLAMQLRLVFDDPAEAARRGREAARRMAADFSYAAVGQRIRDRFKTIDLDAPPIGFLGWMGRSAEKAVFSSQVVGMPHGRRRSDLNTSPLLSVVMPVYNVPGHLLGLCIKSVLTQSYTNWELCICNDGSTRADTIAILDHFRGTSPKIKIRTLAGNSGISAASNAAAEIAIGEYIVLLDNDDELDPQALWEVASAIGGDPGIDCIYSDEDKIDVDGKLIDHFFKPDWSPEHLESVMYVLHMLVVRKRLFHELRGFRSEYDGAQDYDLMLRCSRLTERVHHIRKPLYHWRAIPGSSAEIVDAKPAALTAGLRALQDHATRKYGGHAKVGPGLTAGTFRVHRPIPTGQRVSLLILTNNGQAELPGRGAVSLVDNFVDSILKRTEYQNYEIIVVDNSSLSAAQIARFQQLGVRVENFEMHGKPFNYAAKANFAVSRVRTEHLVLLNDDMEVISPGWLTALLQLSNDPEIGGVGARLLHFDGTIQHVGLVLGINGSAAHVYHSFPGDAIGYNGFTHIIRNYSAVTAACFATRRSVLAQVGGFDEAFAVDFNDIDLCLRMRDAGYRIAYTPFAELYHFEGASAKRTAQDPVEIALFAERWAKCIQDDPFYNPNLARDRLDYAARGWAPRIMAAAE